jgi:hypothetical protein
VTTHLCDSVGGGIQVRADQIAPVLRIKPRRDAGRTDKIAKHHRDMSTLANGFCDGRSSWRRSRWFCGFFREVWSFRTCIDTQSSDCIEELAAVPQCGDAKLLEILRRQVRQDCLVYLILAECRLILSEAKAPQPDHDVHTAPLRS